MSTVVSCPQCRQNLQVRDELLGTTVQCPDCKHAFAAAGRPSGALPPPLAGAAAGPAVSAEAEEYERPLEEDDKGPKRGKRKPDRRSAVPYGGSYYEELRKHQRRRMEDHRGTLILILGILSITCSGIAGIFAYYLGTNDLNEMYAGRMDPSGEGLTKTGRILGIVGIGLNVVGLVLFCFVCPTLGLLTGGGVQR